MEICCETILDGNSAYRGEPSYMECKKSMRQYAELYAIEFAKFITSINLYWDENYKHFTNGCGFTCDKEWLIREFEITKQIIY